MSVFLMGCYDKVSQTFKTVCKAGNGHDDETIIKLQKTLDMLKLSPGETKPKWLDVHSTLLPDFVIRDPFQ